MKTTTVDYVTFTDDSFLPPSTYYYKNFMGDFIFCHTRSRADAQKYADEDCGVAGKYLIRAAKLVQPKGELSAVGHLNSKSRQASRPVR